MGEDILSFRVVVEEKGENSLIFFVSSLSMSLLFELSMRLLI